MSYVTEYPAASPADALAHFRQRLGFETDCADVHAAMQQPDVDFVLLHVVGNAEAFERRHIPGAVHLRHADITAERMLDWPDDTLFVAYCAGPHCNGADQAAWKLAALGRSVKIMIGGITGWQNEGFAFQSGS